MAKFSIVCFEGSNTAVAKGVAKLRTPITWRLVLVLSGSAQVALALASIVISLIYKNQKCLKIMSNMPYGIFCPPLWIFAGVVGIMASFRHTRYMAKGSLVGAVLAALSACMYLVFAALQPTLLHLMREVHRQRLHNRRNDYPYDHHYTGHLCDLDALHTAMHVTVGQLVIGVLELIVALGVCCVCYLVLFKTTTEQNKNASKGSEWTTKYRILQDSGKIRKSNVKSEQSFLVPHNKTVESRSHFLSDDDEEDAAADLSHTRITDHESQRLISVN